ncbi:MAG TPA: tetratricopeptide repeat protein [Ktedonobacteraceae bacterium]
MSSTIQAQRARSGQAQTPTRRVAGLLDALKLRTLKGQFILHASLILLFAGLLTLIGANTFSRASSDLATIDSGSIPSVNYAQQITQDVETIDAQAADYLATAGLTATHLCSIPTDLEGHMNNVALTNHACDEQSIDAETVLANQTLFLAAHNVTYTGEQTAIERITIGLERYLADIHQMRVDFGLATSKTDPNDPYLKQAYQAYLSAGSILHDHIDLDTISAGQIHLDPEQIASGAPLPNCKLVNKQEITPDQWTQAGLTTALDCLSSINHSYLDNAYDDSGNFLGSATAWIIILALLLGLLLVTGTGRMILRSHHILNLGLLAATLLSIIFSISSTVLLTSLQGQSSQGHDSDGAFTQLVQDDYQSVYFAAVLKRVATDANADESRWLIALEFNDQANVSHWQNDWNQNKQQVADLIQQAKNNRTWTEEDQPLSLMDTNWNQRYLSDDDQIRSAAQNLGDPKRLLTAENISTGQSNQDFSDFTSAVDGLAQANQNHYNQTFASINSTLMVYFVLSLVFFPLTGLLALWGVAQRLKDF